MREMGQERKHIVGVKGRQCEVILHSDLEEGAIGWSALPFLDASPRVTP